MSDTRIKWIDNVKGIAIILLILGHVGGKYFSWVYGVHLTCFLLMTGYTLKVCDLNKNYLNKTFDRLMIPYFITSIFLLMFNIVKVLIKTNDINNVPNTILSSLLDVFVASGSNSIICGIELSSRIGALWYLPALFFGLVLIQVLFKLFNITDNTSYKSKEFIQVGGGCWFLV